MKFLQKWASNPLFTSGPKAGSLSKLPPGAIVADGIQPGTGQRIAAEEMNYVLDALISRYTADVLNAAEVHWTSNQGAMVGVGYNKSAGYFLVQADGDLWRRGQAGVMASVGSLPGSVTVADTAMGDSVAGGGLGNYIVGIDGANAVAYYSNALGVGEDYAQCASTPAAAGLTSVAYDDVNGSLIVVYFDEGALSSFFRIADAATPDLVAAATAPSKVVPAIVPAGSGVAAGGGVALVCYIEDDPSLALAAYKSTDGGANWAAVGVPTFTAASGDHVAKVAYEENFLGAGGAFIIHLFDDDLLELRTWYTRDDGGSWTEIVHSPALKGNNSTNSTIQIGDLVITTQATGGRITDLRTGESHRNSWDGELKYAEGVVLIDQQHVSGVIEPPAPLA